MPTVNPSMFDHLDKLAVVSGGLFAGTALYMTIGEVPALRAWGLDEHWRFFPFMYERAAVSQIVFTSVAGVTGILHGSRIIDGPFDRKLWVMAGSIFLGMIPYTLVCIMPTNKIILGDNKRIQSGNSSEVNDDKKKELLEKWNLLHLGRTVGSVLGFSAMVYGLSRHASLRLGW